MSWNGDQNLQYRPPRQVHTHLIQSRGFLQIPSPQIGQQQQQKLQKYNINSLHPSQSKD